MHLYRQWYAFFFFFHYSQPSYRAYNNYAQVTRLIDSFSHSTSRHRRGPFTDPADQITSSIYLCALHVRAYTCGVYVRCVEVRGIRRTLRNIVPTKEITIERNTKNQKREKNREKPSFPYFSRVSPPPLTRFHFRSRDM